jgi:hypothetical protein
MAAHQYYYCKGRDQKPHRLCHAPNHRVDLIDDQLNGAIRQQEILLDPYLSSESNKGLLVERKCRLETTIANLRREREQLSIHLGEMTYSDQDISMIEELCAKLRENLNMSTYEGIRRIMELLDVNDTLVVENGEKVLHLMICLISPQPVLLALISRLSNTGNRQQPIIITARLVHDCPMYLTV